MNREELFQRVIEGRDAFWSKVGTVDPEMLVSTAYAGGPQWPTLRQAFRIVRRDGGIILASDGLTDAPAEPERPEGGFEMEVYAETRDPLGDEIQESWLFQIVWQVTQLAASRGGLGDLLDQVDVLSTEIEITDPGLSSFLNENGRAGVMVNLVDDKSVPSRLELPNGPARIVNAKLLYPPELAFIVENGDRGRLELAKRLLAQADPLVSALHREPVV